ncbi:MAG: STN and carboxypeptidase regulatory-like domain-containing protein [Pedobacter sp.]|uniref:STN and carboxypeptidase regulatory-like domain-containing protein n=1 Tax=Pedobacter sp. TaxID=1411316 RepID=UPI002809C271|nr:STN and carboxypeptidase regulatory-like domain-containing protein [Pedobacter sp.]MDQ8003607.1 STN and carboxypeptidase regulatory-like domain-containing protein [Pedobacter sp.]
MKTKLLVALFFISFFCAAQTSVNYNQSNLAKLVTLDVKSLKISTVLQKIGNAGGFYFAYNGALFGQDSIVNLSVRNKPVRDVLDQLFDGKVAYKENNEYIILRYAVNHFAIEAESIVTAENLYAISGRVVDTQTGKKVRNASVYEKRLLESAITDDEGYFSLKFKGNHNAIVLTASKETYRDTSIIFLSSIDVKPQGYDDPDKEKGTFVSNMLESFGISRWLTSSKQRIQNMNIPNFLANMPVQASITPGLSSHGSMSGSVVNKFSLNLMGGYTAGVDGAEIAGIFNMNKADVRYVQVAGVLNINGGNTEGAQIAGVVNMVGQNANGVQVSGVYNHVRGKTNGIQISTANYSRGLVEGMQISALGNLAKNDLRGLQITGLLNIVGKETKGFQLSAFGNTALGNMKGVQISGIINYAKRNKGFQLGLINIADTSSGVSLGLINVVRHGYHKISLSSNDLINANASFKSGNANLYTIFLLGKNFVENEKIETFGFGFGHDFFAGKRLSVSTELTVQHLHLGRWDYPNILHKLQVNLQVRIFKGFAIYGAPVLNYYISGAPLNYIAANGYKSQIAPANSRTVNGNSGWLGWAAGINIF